MRMRKDGVMDYSLSPSRKVQDLHPAACQDMSGAFDRILGLSQLQVVELGAERESNIFEEGAEQHVGRCVDRGRLFVPGLRPS
jgi:hypothetical protein